MAAVSKAFDSLSFYECSTSPDLNVQRCVEALERKLEAMENEVGKYMRISEEQKEVFSDAVQKAMAELRNELGQTINDARAEFNKIREEMGAVWGQAGSAVGELRERIQQLEMGSTGEGGGEDGIRKGGGKGGYLPMKNMTPKVLSKEEEYRSWKEDVEDYLDESMPGMRELLKELAGERELTTEDGVKFKAVKLKVEIDVSQESSCMEGLKMVNRKRK